LEAPATRTVIAWPARRVSRMPIPKPPFASSTAGTVGRGRPA
jgi:hypothetical protein